MPSGSTVQRQKSRRRWQETAIAIVLVAVASPATMAESTLRIVTDSGAVPLSDPQPSDTLQSALSRTESKRARAGGDPPTSHELSVIASQRFTSRRTVVIEGGGELAPRLAAAVRRSSNRVPLPSAAANSTQSPSAIVGLGPSFVEERVVAPPPALEPQSTPVVLNPTPAGTSVSKPRTDPNPLLPTVALTEPQSVRSEGLPASPTELPPLSIIQHSSEADIDAASPALEVPLPGLDPPADDGNRPCPQCACPYGRGQSGTANIWGVNCGASGAPCDRTWNDARCIPWSIFGPGEYVGPPRPEHTWTYYLRVNDLLTLTFIESRQKTVERYRIGVGDRLKLEWLKGSSTTAATPLDREVTVQPDGSVPLPLIGDANAAGKTVEELQREVIELYSKYQRDPQITITPLNVNTAVQDLLQAVIGRNANAGQVQDLRVTPEGTIQAAGIGSVYVQGLTLVELRSELEARYAAIFGPGLLVSPALTERATNYAFVGGEVRSPGRYTLEGPTTVSQAIAMAGGWNNGGNLREVVIFRRDENWCLKATKIDLRAPLYGNDPCPVNDVWLRDNDLVVVPKQKILCATDVIELYFTRGIYAVVPITYVYNFSSNSAITPVP
jgi:polysaccharide export outer membrane protein